MSDLLTTEETARLLHLNVKRVQALARSGHLPAMRSGRRWLFPRAELLHAMRPQGDPLQTASLPEPSPVDLSARNQLRGRVDRLVVDGLMAEVHIAIGDQTLVSLITRSSAERLGLEPGREVLAIIKSTEVMVGLRTS